MRVLAHVHKYLPVHRSGAEGYLHEILSFLLKNGHEVQVAGRDVGSDYDYEGISVRALKGDRIAQLKEAYQWCDVAVTHLDLTRGAIVEAQRAKKPIVHLVHNERTLSVQGVKRTTADLVVFNSDWLKRHVEYVQGDRRFLDVSMTVRPLVRVHAYKMCAPYQRRDHLTLINLSDNKGAPLFYQLAGLMPERKFLGVEGSYHEQIPPPNLPNIEIIPNGEILPVYERTSILLMPSFYESYGKTALEAACSGIPTIAHPTPGLLEALGGAGIFAGRLIPSAWVEWISRLDDPHIRQTMSDAAFEQAHRQQVRALEEMREMEERMRECASRT